MWEGAGRRARARVDWEAGGRRAGGGRREAVRVRRRLRLLVWQREAIVEVAAPDEELAARQGGVGADRAALPPLVEHAQPQPPHHFVELCVPPVRPLLPGGEVAAEEGEARALEEEGRRHRALVVAEAMEALAGLEDRAWSIGAE